MFAAITKEEWLILLNFLKNERLRLDFVWNISPFIGDLNEGLAYYPSRDELFDLYKKFRSKYDFSASKFRSAIRILCETEQFERFLKIPQDLCMSLDSLLLAEFDEKNLRIVLDCFELKSDMQQKWFTWYEFCGSGISLEFETHARAARFLNEKSVYSPAWTILYILREVYGESLVLEVLKRYGNEATDHKLSDLPKLLADWDKYREYPLTWTQAML